MLDESQIISVVYEICFFNDFWCVCVCIYVGVYVCACAREHLCDDVVMREWQWQATVSVRWRV
jgi:hypothetical protein